MNLKKELDGILPAESILADYPSRAAFGPDAGFYSLIPEVVVFPDTVEEVQALMAYCLKNKLHYTFRAAGTSLSGQSITDGMLIVFSRGWKNVEVLEAGKKVRVQPGVIGQMVNAHLMPHGAKLGPDPASIASAMIGGIINNNSSGMCCGVAQNSYHTIDSIDFVLPNGLRFNTANPDDYERFDAEAASISAGLLSLRSRILANAPLLEKIMRKYKRKNTVGYALNAFVDYERPLDIMRQLLIGSEGTLACVVEAVFNTVPTLPHKYTGLLVFPTIEDAAEAIVPLEASGATALEIMDYASLKAIAGKEGMPEYLGDIQDGASAILVEYQRATDDELQAVISGSGELFSGLTLLFDPDFTTDKARQAAFWKIRKGLFPAVGAVRAQGSTVIIEDVGFPIDKLAAGVKDLQELFKKYGYDNAIIFGHAKDGNLHFVITPTFGQAEAVDTYAAFIDDLVEVVVTKHDGELKSEHGTGRNMAPFVETEWGGDALEIMKELKALIDPDHLLNRGVIINDDDRCHLANIKETPVIEPVVDSCIACGFCEAVCPSRDLTQSPRRRINMRREFHRLTLLGGHDEKLVELQTAMQRQVLDTCAVDGLCASSCPVGINTGELVEQLRSENTSRFANGVAMFSSRHLGLVERLVRMSLRAGHLASWVVGEKRLYGLTKLLAKLAPGQIPMWVPGMPKAAGPLPNRWEIDSKYLIMPSCITRTMDSGAISIPEALVTLSDRAGISVDLPNTAGLCCGKPFSSKGYRAAYIDSVTRMVQRAFEMSGNGHMTVVIDNSPCTLTLLSCREDLDEETRAIYDQIRFIDMVEFVGSVLLQHLDLNPVNENVAVHPVCSVTKMGLEDKLLRIATSVARSASVPNGAGCCGAAGDRLWLVPELTASAMSAEAASIRSSGFDSCCSSSLTCQTAIERASDQPTVSIVHLLERASR